MPNQFLSPEGDLETFNYFVTEYWLIDQYVGDTLWGWGRNDSGQMGDNSTVSGSIPVTTFVGGANWKQVYVADRSTFAIKTDGTLWVWGRANNGELGNNDAASGFPVCTPVTTFAGGTDWKQITAVSTGTGAAIKTDGTLWLWGPNADGQLGVNDTTKRSTPVTTFAGGTNWKQVSGGARHISAIKTDGTLWTWGRNSFFGQLGVNDSTQRNTPVTTFAGGTNWKQVSCGGYHTTAIKTDGTLWLWGCNSPNGAVGGILGDNTLTNRSTPVTTFAGGTNWKQVSGGIFHTTAIKTDGTLWAWGYNALGAVGDNTGIDRSTPVTTFAGGNNWKYLGFGSSTANAAIKTDGTLWTWGRNNIRQVGDTTLINRSTPVTTFAGGTNWKQISLGYHMVAVTSGTDPTFFIA